MSAQLNIKQVLWKHDSKSDKVWGAFDVAGNIYTFWGRRKGSMQFKSHGPVDSKTFIGVNQMVTQKLKKGYRILSAKETGQMVEDLGLRKQLVNSKLLDKVR